MYDRTSREIDDQAAEWAAKTEYGQLSATDEAALDRWLSADPRHLGAFAKARAVTVHMRRAKALGPEFDPSGFSEQAETSTNFVAKNVSRRRFVVNSGIAASVAALGVGGIAWRIWGRKTYSTTIGETRIVPLQDGSVVTLNTNTEVAVNYTKRRRDIDLIQGEALFDVAKDKQRPFVVAADGTMVQALGTSFTVALLEDQPVKVLVREGVVEIRRPDTLQATPVVAHAETRAVAPKNAPIRAAKVDQSEITRELSWRIGRLAFEGETLGQAAAEFARYSDTRIIIDDPEIAQETITGLYVSNDPVGFSRAVALSLGLQARLESGEIHLGK